MRTAIAHGQAITLALVDRRWLPPALASLGVLGAALALVVASGDPEPKSYNERCQQVRNTSTRQPLENAEANEVIRPQGLSGPIPIPIDAPCIEVEQPTP